jgi:hypothetical protein
MDSRARRIWGKVKLGISLSLKSSLTFFFLRQCKHPLRRAGGGRVLRKELRMIPVLRGKKKLTNSAEILVATIWR